MLPTVETERETIERIAEAIKTHADGLAMDDPADRNAMAKWIAGNFYPKLGGALAMMGEKKEESSVAERRKEWVPGFPYDIPEPKP